MERIKEIDEEISSLVKAVSFYSYLTPLNRKEEESSFFSSLKKGEKYNPVYLYKEANLLKEEKALRDLKDELDKDNELEKLFIKKIDYILDQLEFLKQKDEEILDFSYRIFGKESPGCIELALEILNDSISWDEMFTEENVTPEEILSVLEKEIKSSGIDWHVKISDKIVPKVTVSGQDKTLYINSHIKYTKEEVERLKVHEILVHIYRGANGEKQGFNLFKEGLAGYSETEEGLALYAEEKNGCYEYDKRQKKLYAGRALASKYCSELGFYESFIKLKEYFPDDIAFRLVERIKRGMKDTSKKGCLTNGYHYINGLIKLKKYLKEDGDLRLLFVGKIGVEDVDGVKSLLEKKILIEPEYLPGFVG